MEQGGREFYHEPIILFDSHAEDGLRLSATLSASSLIDEPSLSSISDDCIEFAISLGRESCRDGGFDFATDSRDVDAAAVANAFAARYAFTLLAHITYATSPDLFSYSDASPADAQHAFHADLQEGAMRFAAFERMRLEITPMPASRDEERCCPSPP